MRRITAKHFTPWLNPFDADEMFGSKILYSKAWHLVANRQYYQKHVNTSIFQNWHKILSISNAEKKTVIFSSFISLFKFIKVILLVYE